MSHRALTLAAAFALATGSFVTAQEATPASGAARAAACSSAEHRQFDFWIGDWDVHQADGKLAGRNTITRVYGGCVLEERYQGARGYAGGSFNVYDASRDRWHQTWVDNSGLLLELDGQFQNGRMVLKGETRDSTGAVLVQRITWEPVQGGKVRQHWEQSADAGGSWTTLFDGIYTRRR